MNAVHGYALASAALLVATARLSIITSIFPTMGYYALQASWQVYKNIVEGKLPIQNETGKPEGIFPLKYTPLGSSGMRGF